MYRLILSMDLLMIMFKSKLALTVFILYRSLTETSAPIITRFTTNVQCEKCQWQYPSDQRS